MTETHPLPEAIETECVVIGAGPSGLFSVFELGLLGMKCHVVDSLQHPGGQCAELYPDKPIYDIPALPVCGAQELVDRLMQQIKPFKPEFHLAQTVTRLERTPDGRFLLETSNGTRFDAGAVVLASGLGAFEPRRLRALGAESWEGRNIHYRVRDPDSLAGKRLIILGGGDSALLHLEPVVLIHNRCIQSIDDHRLLVPCSGTGFLARVQLQHRFTSRLIPVSVGLGAARHFQRAVCFTSETRSITWRGLSRVARTFWNWVTHAGHEVSRS